MWNIIRTIWSGESGQPRRWFCVVVQSTRPSSWCCLVSAMPMIWRNLDFLWWQIYLVLAKISRTTWRCISIRLVNPIVSCVNIKISWNSWRMFALWNTEFIIWTLSKNGLWTDNLVLTGRKELCYICDPPPHPQDLPILCGAKQDSAHTAASKWNVFQNVLDYRTLFWFFM